MTTTDTTATDLANVETAFARGDCNWTGLDWETDASLAVRDAERSVAGAEGAIAVAGNLNTDTVEDIIRLAEAKEALSAAEAKARAEEARIEDEAAQAQTLAEEALDHARRGDWAEASRAARAASDIEGEYGASPTWGRLHRACELPAEAVSV